MCENPGSRGNLGVRLPAGQAGVVEFRWQRERSRGGTIRYYCYVDDEIVGYVTRAEVCPLARTGKWLAVRFGGGDHEIFGSLKDGKRYVEVRTEG